MHGLMRVRRVPLDVAILRVWASNALAADPIQILSSFHFRDVRTALVPHPATGWPMSGRIPIPVIPERW